MMIKKFNKQKDDEISLAGITKTSGQLQLKTLFEKLRMRNKELEDQILREEQNILDIQNNEAEGKGNNMTSTKTNEELRAELYKNKKKSQQERK